MGTQYRPPLSEQDLEISETDQVFSGLNDDLGNDDFENLNGS